MVLSQFWSPLRTIWTLPSLLLLLLLLTVGSTAARFRLVVAGEGELIASAVRPRPHRRVAARLVVGGAVKTPLADPGGPPADWAWCGGRADPYS
eukprot:384122-Prorocentrum_minimum.AAC.1